jgi:hypothetical protein
MPALAVGCRDCFQLITCGDMSDPSDTLPEKLKPIARIFYRVKYGQTKTLVAIRTLIVIAVLGAIALFVWLDWS